MNPGSRAAIAFIAGSLIGRKHAASVYDYSEGAHRLFSGTVQSNNVQIFDHTDNCNIGGSGSNNQFSLYHYGEGGHISLNISGNSFSRL